MRRGPRTPALGSAVTSPCLSCSHPILASSGKLVIKDQDETIVLRTRHILIDNGGQLHAGSALCPFQGNFTIILYGRWVKCSLDLMGGGLSKERRGQDNRASVQDGVCNMFCQAVGTRRADTGDGRAGEARGGIGCCGLGPCCPYRRPCQPASRLPITARLREAP